MTFEVVIPNWIVWLIIVSCMTSIIFVIIPIMHYPRAEGQKFWDWLWEAILGGH